MENTIKYKDRNLGDVFMILDFFFQFSSFV